MNLIDPMRDLPRELPPPPAMRLRVLNALRSRGLVAGSGRQRWLTAAAATIAFVAGLSIGRTTTPADPLAAGAGATRFALLLFEPSSFDTTASHDALAAEYGQWAASLGAQFVSGDALGDSRTLGGDAPAVEPTGFFIITAANYDAAVAVARECPHLRHGGVVSVRTVPTS